MNCLYCGSPAVDEIGYCRECGLKQAILYKAYNTSNYYYNLGLDRAKIRDLTGAEEALKLSLKYDKRNTNARNLLGLIYYEIGEWTLALSHWVISMNYQSGKTNPAAGYVKKLQSSTARLDANNRMSVQYNQALGHAQAGNVDLALIQVKKVLNGQPHFVKGFLLLSLLYILEGNYDKAKKALKRVLKIDRFNPTALHYMKEMEPVGMVQEENPEDEFDSYYMEDFGDEEAPKQSLGDLLEGKMLDDELQEASLQVGHYKDTNLAKYALVYVIVGLILGIASMTFLIMPSRVNAVREEYADIKLIFSDEIAKKNAAYSDLESKYESLNQDYESLKKDLEEVTNKNGAAKYEALFEARALYGENKIEDAIWKLDGIEEADFTSEEAKKMFRTIMEAGKGDFYMSLYNEGLKALESEDYEKAVQYLKLAVTIDGSDQDAWVALQKAYEGVDDLENAQKVKAYIQEKFSEDTSKDDEDAMIDGEDTPEDTPDDEQE